MTDKLRKQYRLCKELVFEQFCELERLLSSILIEYGPVRPDGLIRSRRVFSNASCCSTEEGLGLRRRDALVIRHGGLNGYKAQ